MQKSFNLQSITAFNQSNEINELKTFNSVIEFRLSQAGLMNDWRLISGISGIL